MESVGVAVVLLLLFIPMTLAQLRLSFMRSPDSNVITLECKDGGIPVNDADFWIDDPATPLPFILDGLGVPYTPEGSTILFTLQRELEGAYFCGRIDQGTSSSPEELVGKWHCIS